MFYITGKLTLLVPGTEVFVHHKVVFKFALVYLKMKIRT